MKRVALLNIILLMSVFSFSCSDTLQVGDSCNKEYAHECVNGTFGFCDRDSQIIYVESCDSICHRYGYPIGEWFYEGHCSQDWSDIGQTYYDCCTCVHEESGVMDCVLTGSEGAVHN